MGLFRIFGTTELYRGSGLATERDCILLVLELIGCTQPWCNRELPNNCLLAENCPT